MASAVERVFRLPFVAMLIEAGISTFHSLQGVSVSLLAGVDVSSAKIVFHKESHCQGCTYLRALL